MKLKKAQGFTLLEIMIVTSLIGMLAAIGIPNMIKARMTSQKGACISNLRQIDQAIQQWALENLKSPSSQVTTSDVTPFLRNTPICPAGGTTFADSYSLSTVDLPALCAKQPADHVLP